MVGAKIAYAILMHRRKLAGWIHFNGNDTVAH